MNKLNHLIPINKITFLALFLLLSSFSFSQETKNWETIMFYNTENLFDPFDDPNTNDNQFLPDGEKHWNFRRLQNKLNRIFQVIIASGEGKLPVVVGLCEIENNSVLELLLNRTPLGKLGYKYIHKDSPDSRGIDVAFLYNNNSFSPISYRFITISSKEHPLRTRDILCVSGLIQKDTIHFYINHWPSKFGGAIETKESRALAASLLKNDLTSLPSEENSKKVIIMGDFNDSPSDESIINILGASKIDIIPNPEKLYNLSLDLSEKGIGTNKHGYQWIMLDQIIVSGKMLSGKGVYTKSECFKVISFPFLLEKDKNNLGTKPFRTYLGFRYHNGFSDHLPVTCKLLY